VACTRFRRHRVRCFDRDGVERDDGSDRARRIGLSRCSLDGTVAPAGGNTCALRPVSLDLEAPVGCLVQCAA
jgi:hypothetical protein